MTKNDNQEETMRHIRVLVAALLVAPVTTPMLAQWLHGFYASHAKPFPIKIETLHRLCGSPFRGGLPHARAHRQSAWYERCANLHEI